MRIWKSCLYRSDIAFYGLEVIKLGQKFAWTVVIPFACSHGQRLNADPPSHNENAPLATTGNAPAPPLESAAKPPDHPIGATESPAASTERPSTARPQPSSTEDSPAIGSNASAKNSAAPVPKLVDAAGQPLPQTEELPSFDSPSFQRRIQLLFEAIVKDDPKLATPAFFPVLAYEQVKAISQPARDHKLRLLAAFSKNIHDYHRQISKLTGVKLVGLAPSTLAPRWMKPGTEGNKLGYHRLLRSKLRLTSSNGKEVVFEITSMISWRGEWYVVHLNGFS